MDSFFGRGHAYELPGNKIQVQALRNRCSLAGIIHHSSRFPGKSNQWTWYPERRPYGQSLVEKYDSYACRSPYTDPAVSVANVLVGNDPGMEVLEMTLTGPELLFTAPAILAVCGAQVSVTVDGEEKPMWSRLIIQAGQKLKIGKVAEKGGLRVYLAVTGGFPEM